MTKPNSLSRLASAYDSGGLLGFRNRIINGDMRIDQRNAGASVTPTNGQYLVDRYVFFGTQASKFTAQQNAGSVTPPAGFTNYLGFTSTSSYSTTSSDVFAVVQIVEGLNVADLGWGTVNAQAVTVSFKVYSSLAGSFGGSICNGTGDRSYPFAYSVSSPNTWTAVSITIPGDTTGSWLKTNGIGLEVRFGLGAGSSFSGTANTWNAANAVQPSGTVSVVGTNGATFYITGVQLEVGTAATSFEFRDYGRELIMCQRYYFKQSFAQTQTWAYGHGQTANTARITTQAPVSMRTAPSFNSTATNVANYAGFNGAVVVSGGSAMSATSVVDYTATNITLQTTASGVLGVVTAYGYAGFNEYSSEL